MRNRFYQNGNCKCQHIVDKTCKQCIVCECCEFYVEAIKHTSTVPRGMYIWGGELRGKNSARGL